MMKRSRPGIVLTALCPPDRVGELSRVLFEESTTIGVRWSEWRRARLDREMVDARTDYGAIPFKVSRLGGRIVTVTPEFADVARIARESPCRCARSSTRPAPPAASFSLRRPRRRAGRVRHHEPCTSRDLTAAACEARRTPAAPRPARNHRATRAPRLRRGASAPPRGASRAPHVVDTGAPGLRLSPRKTCRRSTNSPNPGGRVVKLPVKMTINGQSYSHEVEPRLLLVHYIRETVGLTGTHVGCDTSQCGACTILMNGQGREGLHALRRPGRRREHHDHRGPGQERRAASDPAGLLGEARAAVRLLHARA